MGSSNNESEGKLDKLKLNNQIVKMRKDVRRARLWLINNLSGRSKKLLVKKGNEQQVSKNQRKAERLKQEIDTLKHIDIDDVSKFALSNKQDPAEVLKTLDQLPVDQRSMMRLAMHKLVQDQVAKFRQAFPVPLDRVVLLIRALGIRYQKKKDKKPEKEKQEKKPSAKMTSSSAAKLRPNNTERAQKDELQTTDKSDESNQNETTKEVDKKIDRDVGQEDKEETPAEHQDGEGLPDENMSQKIIKKKESDTKTKAKVKVEWPTMFVPSYEKREGTMEIKRIDLTQSESISDDNVEVSRTDDRQDDAETAQKPLDSFFLGGQSSDEDDNDNEQLKGRWNRKELGVNRKHREPATTKFSKPKPDFSRKEREPINFKPARRLPEKNAKVEEKKPELDEQNLHPSWQAKRKQKEQSNPITAFQGKKIKFDDD